MPLRGCDLGCFGLSTRSSSSVIGPMIDQQVTDATRLVELGEGGGLVLLESLIRSHDTKLNMIDLRRDLALACSGSELPARSGVADRGFDTGVRGRHRRRGNEMNTMTMD